MFTKEEWKKNLLGCFEIVLFMPAGVQRFSKDRQDAIRSFLIPLIILPFTLMLFVLMSSGFSWSFILSLHFVRMVLTLLLFITAVYFLTKQFGRDRYFYQFLSAINWFNIPSLLLTLPILWGLMQGIEMSYFESYAVFVTLLGYVFSAFIITHAFRIPWEMGGFIAIVGLAIDQNLLDLALYVRDTIGA